MSSPLAPSDYPYSGRDLFAEPETYEYAPAGDALVRAWRDSRRRAIDRLVRSAAVGAPPASRPKSESLDAILDALAAGREPDGYDVKGGVLAGLVTKFEIFRRLFRSYDRQLRKTSGAAPANPDDYVRFAQIVVAQHENENRGRMLSTLMKLNDALTALPVEQFTAASCRALVAVLEREDVLVQRWQQMVETRRA